MRYHFTSGTQHDFTAKFFLLCTAPWVRWAGMNTQCCSWSSWQSYMPKACSMSNSISPSNWYLKIQQGKKRKNLYEQVETISKQWIATAKVLVLLPLFSTAADSCFPGISAVHCSCWCSPISSSFLLSSQGFRQLRLLVENRGRVNYGLALNEQRKGELSLLFMEPLTVRDASLGLSTAKLSFLCNLQTADWCSSVSCSQGVGGNGVTEGTCVNCCSSLPVCSDCRWRVAAAWQIALRLLIL